MKANRKFVEGREAVSAVIGVILMVAITVAIAATVYVWVTGFGGGGTPAPSMSINQDAAVSSDGNVNLTVISASGNARWEDLKIIVNDTELKWDGNKYVSNGGQTREGTVSAGDKIWLQNATHVKAGNTLQIIHTPSNSVIVTKTLY